MNVAELEREAKKHHKCPRCGSEPTKRCWERVPGTIRHRFKARVHQERVDEVVWQNEIDQAVKDD